jgi:hypothetical protein
MPAHFAIRQLLHAAALRADEDPDRLSFFQAVRASVACRRQPPFSPWQQRLYEVVLAVPLSLRGQMQDEQLPVATSQRPATARPASCRDRDRRANRIGAIASDPKVDSTFGNDPMLQSLSGASFDAEKWTHFSARCAK